MLTGGRCGARLTNTRGTDKHASGKSTGLQNPITVACDIYPFKNVWMVASSLAVVGAIGGRCGCNSEAVDPFEGLPHMTVPAHPKAITRSMLPNQHLALERQRCQEHYQEPVPFCAGSVWRNTRVWCTPDPVVQGWPRDRFRDESFRCHMRPLSNAYLDLSTSSHCISRMVGWCVNI